MPNGHLINQIGYGDSTVWNPTPEVQNFAAILQQQKAERAAKEQSLVSQLASIKPTGIRQADTDDFKNQFDGYKQAYISAQNAPKNSRQRIDALTDAQQKYDDLNEFIDRSKNEKSREQSLANQWIANQHLFSDEAHGKFIKSMNAPMSSGDYIPSQNYGSFERFVDPVKMDQLYGTLKKGKITGSEWDNGIQAPGMEGNRKGVFITQSRGVPIDGEGGALHSVLNLATASNDFKKYIQDRYKGIQGDTPQQSFGLQAMQYMKDMGDGNGFYEKSKPTFKANDLSELHRQERMEDAIERKKLGLGANSNEATYRQQQVQGIMNGNQEAIDKAKANLPPGSNVEFLTSQPHPSDKSIPKGSKGGYNLVRVTVPSTFVNGQFKAGTKQDISLTDANAMDKLNFFLNQFGHEQVSASKLNIEGGKPRGDMVNLSKNPQAQQPGTTPPSQHKTIKQSDIALKAAAAGYSVKEYTDLLKQKGVVIK